MQINAFVAHRGEFYRLLSASFLHHGPMHLLGNMLSLHWIAPDLERVVGKPLLLALYAAGALGGGMLHLTYGPMGSVLVGASGGAFKCRRVSMVFVTPPLLLFAAGAITGMLGATIVFKWRNRT
jgi:membrane associated rhomboid family serine protease